MTERNRRLLSLWLPVVLWAGVIVFFSHVPYLKSPFRLDWYYRKAAHVFEYAVLAGLLARAFHGTGFRGVLAWSFVSAALFAVTDELHQNFVPGRYGTWRDFRFDTVGNLLGLASWRLGRAWLPHGKETRTALPGRPRGRSPDPRGAERGS